MTATATETERWVVEMEPVRITDEHWVCRAHWVNADGTADPAEWVRSDDPALEDVIESYPTMAKAMKATRNAARETLADSLADRMSSLDLDALLAVQAFLATLK